MSEEARVKRLLEIVKERDWQAKMLERASGYAYAAAVCNSRPMSVNIEAKRWLEEYKKGPQ